MEIVEVTWVDACIEEAHIPVEVLPNIKPLVRRNAGYCWQNNDESLQLIFGLIENFHKGQTAYDMVLTIPKAMIKSIKKIEPI